MNAHADVLLLWTALPILRCAWLEAGVCGLFRLDWQRLNHRRGDTVVTRMEKLKAAGLKFHQATVSTLQSAKQWLQEILGITAQEAADLVSEAGQGTDSSLSEAEPEDTPEPGGYATHWDKEPEHDKDADVDVVRAGSGRSRLQPLEVAAMAAPDGQQQVLCLPLGLRTGQG